MSTFERLADQLTGRLDGPHGDDHTTAVARLAAEAIRYLNYATGPHAGAGLTEPATVYTVIGNLAHLASGLTQTCDQLARWPEREHAAGWLACDTREPTEVAVGPAVDKLAVAVRLTNELATALGAAQTATGHLKRPEEGERP